MKSKLTGYKRYQLEWMIEHGYSLEDLMTRMDDIVDDLYHPCDRPLPSDAMEEFENLGFKESEIWTCEDEWEQNEALEDDEVTLFECATEMLKENPYLKTGQHKELIEMVVSEYADCTDEIVFYIEKDWLYEYAECELEIKDVDYWLQNEYTSDDSEPVLLAGIQAGVVAGIYK